MYRSRHRSGTHNPILIALAIVVLSTLPACSDGYKKGENGLRYKVIKLGEGREVEPGDWLKLQVMQRYNDSILSDTRRTMPQYMRFDSNDMTRESLSIFTGTSTGDSLIFRTPPDSALRKKKPALIRQPGFLLTTVKILDIFRTEQAARADADSMRRTPPPGMSSH